MIQTFAIPDWHPTRLNELLNSHWAKAQRRKNEDAGLIAVYACGANIRKARRGQRRRVSVVLTLAPRQRAGDPDAYWKSLLDGLKRAGLIADDNRQGVELMPLQFERGQTRKTTITLEDL